MMSYHIALTALTGRVCPHELAEAAAALQTQVMRDFLPEWGVSAVVSSASFDAIPAGAIPIIVQDELNDTAGYGFHRTRLDDTPYIMVPFGPNWSLAASHELLRMLANPSGSTRLPGSSRVYGQGMVEYLLDVCAPCQDVTASYAINGVAVSDFCTRGFFTGSGAANSYTGAVQRVLEPIANGVVTWLADDDLLYQARGDSRGRIQIHGGFSLANRGRMMLRELVDRLVPDRLPRLANAPRTPHLMEAEQNARRAHLANMTRFRDDIAWRFGDGSLETRIAEARRDVRRRAFEVPGTTRQPVSRAAGEVEMTVRNAS
jgi:hypothetical protein